MKVTAYSTLAQPTLEYNTVVWDPYQQYLINSIEMVQWRAARWVKQEWSITASVTAILNNLEWNLLSKRRQYSRLILFLKFYIKTHLLSEYHNIISPPSWLITHGTLTIYTTYYIPPSTSKTYFQKSFFLRNHRLE